MDLLILWIILLLLLIIGIAILLLPEGISTTLADDVYLYKTRRVRNYYL